MTEIALQEKAVFRKAIPQEEKSSIRRAAESAQLRRSDVDMESAKALSIADESSISVRLGCCFTSCFTAVTCNIVLFIETNSFVAGPCLNQP